MMEEPSADISRLYETGNALYRWATSTKIGPSPASTHCNTATHVELTLRVDCRPQPMKAAVNPPALAEAGEEGTPRPAASDAAPPPIMPVSAGQQHMLTF